MAQSHARQRDSLSIWNNVANQGSLAQLLTAFYNRCGLSFLKIQAMIAEQAATASLFNLWRFHEVQPHWMLRGSNKHDIWQT
jgi:hypothetical protein